ncbi:cupin domain-containing protein [Cryobacterium sp. Sr8]|uniref:cupin domain-containing protein n=1 Tax=Cryobacterium sp. Sr8 TaxID=1259203 RepID=UPI0018E0A6D7|nr:cupin domain-containing protein [Cryobacterium sp. Sr8]
MSTNPAKMPGIRVITVRDVEATGDPTAVDRYVIDSSDSGGLIAVVEHALAPRVLAAPIHKHSREDEYSLVLDGRLGVVQDGDEVVAEPGQLVFKPRGHWHTF